MYLLVTIATAYIVGGLTLLPLLGLMVYIFRHALPSSHHHYQATSSDDDSKESPKRNDYQFYKTGWLRVSRDDFRLPPPDASIGEMVKSYISGRNKLDDPAAHDYFAVLKHSTLFLYDSERQLDCKCVIQVNHHTVLFHPNDLKDFEVYTKPAFIKLKHRDSEDAYYINCNLCTDKEDWYIALLRASHLPVTKDPSARPFDEPVHFDQTAMHNLITTIHSDGHHFQTQWFNALLGRIFFGVYKTDAIKSYLYNKLVLKIAKLNARRPPFLGEITVRSVHPGDGLPLVTQPHLVSLSPTGELMVEGFVQYAGGIRFEIETELKWKYADVLPPLTVDLVLAITLKRLDGKFLMKIKEPPTNRIWYGFYSLPKMQWLVEPVVWEKRVGYSVVVKAIVSKIEELFLENLVLPNLDDITFFPTDGAGGIFNVTADPVTPRTPPSGEESAAAKQPESAQATAALAEQATTTATTNTNSTTAATMTEKQKPKRSNTAKGGQATDEKSKNASKPSASDISSDEINRKLNMLLAQQSTCSTATPMPNVVLPSSPDSLSSSMESTGGSFPANTLAKSLSETTSEHRQIRKSASLARLKAKSQASTSVSTVNVHTVGEGRIPNERTVIAT